jgi:hypothetical protein
LGENISNYVSIYLGSAKSRMEHQQSNTFNKGVTPASESLTDHSSCCFYTLHLQPTQIFYYLLSKRHIKKMVKMAQNRKTIFFIMVNEPKSLFLAHFNPSLWRVHWLSIFWKLTFLLFIFYSKKYRLLILKPWKC